MRSILRLPKLPTLKPKVVGILVIAAVLVVVFAVQKSPDGFQNPTAPLSVKDAEALLMNANNALASVVKELNRWQQEAAAAEEAARASAAAAEKAAAAHASRKAEVAAAMAAVKRLQDDLELKKKAVVNAQQALDNARRAQQLPTTNTKCPYATLKSEELIDTSRVNPIMPPCPACYTAVGVVRAGWMPWSGMMFRCLRNDIVQRDPKMWFEVASNELALAQRAQQVARTPEEAQAAQARMVEAQAAAEAAAATAKALAAGAPASYMPPWQMAAASGLNTTTK